MDNENEFNYSIDNQFKQATPPKKSGSFGKNVFLPFISLLNLLMRFLCNLTLVISLSFREHLKSLYY